MSDFALVCLVSEQPMPNVMAVLQSEQSDRHFTHLEFIVSADKNDSSQYDKAFDEAYKRIKAFFKHQKHINVSRQPPVDPYDIKSVLNACQTAVDTLRNKRFTIVYNITGGTKVMSLAAYICAQHNRLEAIYVESRGRFLITIPPSADLIKAINAGSAVPERKPFDEQLFHMIDVPSYIALYGREINKSIQVSDLDEEDMKKAQIIATDYATLRKRLNHLQNAISAAGKSITWPFHIEIKDLTKREREALDRFNMAGILSWNANQKKISCEKAQRDFLKGRWLEVYALDKLANSGLFHSVRGNVTIKGWDGECDVMLTVNAQLAIIECKSDAKLSE